MKTISRLFTGSKYFFILWCMLAAFGTYFCMYAFRKPFTAGVYAEYSLWGMHYKSILIIAQVFGYMLSKFIGIKVISELRAADRNKLIIGLILFAQAALLLFAVVPHPYNFALLFLNGLPLGMVWGIVFSYLEGRRFTEILAMGLCISLIISSGFLKSIYFAIHHWLPMIPEFWMPAVMGFLFLPLFLLFVWMLSVIPPPDEADKLLRTERVPMTGSDKRNVIANFGWGILCFILIYIMLATMRDFRDNFAVEIWNEIDSAWDKTVFTTTEMITGFMVLISMGSLSIFRDNKKGFYATAALIASGLLLSGLSTFLFHSKLLSPFLWMTLVGMGMFLAYIPIQVVFFERLIALHKIRANAGFFIYLCDSAGYMGSVALLLYKEFFIKELSWSSVLMQFSYMLSAAGIVLLLLGLFFLRRKPSDYSFNSTAPEKLSSL